MHRKAHWLLGLGLSFSLLGSNAFAQDAESASEALQSPVEDQKQVNFIVMPIPMSNPSLGNGLGVVGMALYGPGGSKRPWTTGLGGLYTDTKSWALGAFQKAYLADDRFRLTGGGGMGVFNVDFYGIGSSAGNKGVSIPLEQKSGFAGGQALIRLGHNYYGGFMYRLIDMKTTIRISAADLPIQLPDVELDSTVAQFGVAGEYDTRDTEYGPRKGIYATFQWLYAMKSLDSDFEYPRVTAAINGYHELSPKAVLAWRGSVCFSGDDAPFYDLCSYGQNNDLRGYVTGQYRDHAMVAGQVEYRRKVYKRWGMVAFAGIGEVASALKALNSEDLLPAAGVGVRYAASETYRVNLSVDYAVGKDSHALYFSVGEAF
jgi:outer membrane protein assembly factor BamA